jgi:hypothetical protein
LIWESELLIMLLGLTFYSDKCRIVDQRSILRAAALLMIRSSRLTRFGTTTGAVAPNSLVHMVPNSSKHLQNLNTYCTTGIPVDDDRVGG